MNNNYIDEVIDENEQPAQKKGGKSEKLVRVCLFAVIAAVLVVAVLVAVIVGIENSGEEETTVPVQETTTGVIEITTSPAEKYSVGQYSVNVGPNGKLNLRKEPSKDGEQILAIDNGTLLSITEIYYDETADADSQYWGRTLYKGWDAWVSMKYLITAYAENIVTPAEQTTAAAEELTGQTETTTASAVIELTTSAVVQEATTAAQETTTAAKTETSTASSAYSTGTYKVIAEPHLNMRDDHSVSALSIAQIPANSTVTIVEVYYDANATDSYVKYWGKTSFGGYTGWVAMGYLK